MKMNELKGKLCHSLGYTTASMARVSLSCCFVWFLFFFKKLFGGWGCKDRRQGDVWIKVYDVKFTKKVVKYT